MACECTAYECLPVAPNIFQCGNDITTLLLAEDTTNYMMIYEFDNRWFSEQVLVQQDMPIVIPNVFNEAYTHILYFLIANGTSYQNTCYTLDTRKLLAMAPASSGGGISSGQWITVELTEDTDTFTIPGGDAWLIFPGNQGYVRNIDFTQNGLTITMINGAFFPSGQQLLILVL